MDCRMLFIAFEKTKRPRMFLGYDRGQNRFFWTEDDFSACGFQSSYQAREDAVKFLCTSEPGLSEADARQRIDVTDA